MAAWFEKNNLRRFPRVEMPVKLFITPEKPITDLEIFALGIDYFPTSVQNKINHNHKQLMHWLSHIQEQKEVLEPVFMQMLDAVTVLGDSVKMISLGKSPLNNEKTLKQITGNLKKIGSVADLEKSAPKTHLFLFELEKKLSHFYRLLFLSLHKSTPQKYHSFNPKGHKFKIDDMTAKFNQPTYQKIPLAQTIYFMNELVNNYCEVFQELNSDYSYIGNPKTWQTRDVNISAGGIAVLYRKRFIAGRPLTSRIYFDGYDRVMEFKTVFSHSKTDHNNEGELNAFYFEFPHSQDQKFLELEVEKYQIKKIVSLCLNHQFEASI